MANKKNIMLSIIIVSFNTNKILKSCIDSVIKNSGNLKYEFVIVDNNSTDGSVAYLKRLSQYKNVKVVFNRTNVGYGGANNQGINRALGDYLLFLNSDTYFEKNILKKMVDYLKKHPHIGCISCMLKNSDGTIQGTGGYFPNLLGVFSWMLIQDFPFIDRLIKPFHPMKSRSFFKGTGFYLHEKELDWVTGAFMLMRKKAVNDTGLFDPHYFMYMEEVDYLFRMKKKGWKVLYKPDWSIVHLGGKSGSAGSGILLEFEGVKIFYKKHYPKWQYALLRVILKTGAFWRMCIFGLLKGKVDFTVYAKAFQQI
ncbi:MAG: Glycosyl transferase family 2 [Candidatus Woesebacteria bacterium GW2011_GWA1_39_21]|uniref:Glycosyl transferase family 2 n=1 Tax=Candidatus Woesebacteria bacterium GW2011_GWA1_39_21 TaxID=1618550 RepID=A0A0G0RDL4_9BACT|nr:MAG: Glycosyl transferase family 2 [Candidatus Woesebacteria bacterium GW2011_GWA1_39_21]